MIALGQGQKCNTMEEETTERQRTEEATMAK